jgi:xanthine dehydrogenase small subunit
VDEPTAWAPAIAALAGDFQPLTDMRASAEYRLAVAQNLLKKALLELGGAAGETRVMAPRKAVA